MFLVLSVLVLTSVLQYNATECPAPAPTSRHSAPATPMVQTSVATATSTSVPVPHMPCSFQPKVTTLPEAVILHVHVWMHVLSLSGEGLLMRRTYLVTSQDLPFRAMLCSEPQATCTIYRVQRGVTQIASCVKIHLPQTSTSLSP